MYPFTFIVIIVSWIVFVFLQAEEFRQFWGEKSELRRFQDGAICEAVLWTDKTTINKKRIICSQIVKFILER